MNIGIYKRKSLFSDNSDSIDAQSKICKEYALNNYNVKTIVEYEDEGFTGANTDRPGFKKLMDDVNNKRIDILVCYKIDRISRNVLDFSSTFNALQGNNVQFVSVKEQIDTSTPLGRAMMYICSVFAQMERETTAERVKDSLIELAKSGKWPGGSAPVGYKREKILIGGKYHTTLVKNDEEVKYLNIIFDTFLEGYSLVGLETYFKKKGFKTLSGNFFSSTQIYQILKNPHYVTASPEIYDFFREKGCKMACEKEKFSGENGVIVYGRTSGGKKKIHQVNSPDKWIVSVGLHKSLISPEKWLSVQSRFNKNMIDKTRKHEIGLLKGILKCNCGHIMRVQHKVDTQYNKVYNHYYCRNRIQKGTDYCNTKAIAVDLIDEKFITMLKKLSTDKTLLKQYIGNSEKNNNISRDIDTINRDLSSTMKKIQNLTITLQENSVSTASKYIILEIEKLDKRIIELNYELREIELLEQRNKKQETDINIIYSKIVNYINNFDKLDYFDKVKYLQEFIRECIWDDGKLKIII